jgi:hypothetical protein
LALLVEQIPLDLRDFTVHDVTHLDALWEMASLCSGAHYTLSPLEGFVLGGAILLHDAGMSLAAYPGGLHDLRREKTWPDAVAVAFQKLRGRRATLTELVAPGDDVEHLAAQELIRQLHAVQAEKLCSLSWADRPGDEPHYLLEDSDLRLSVGSLIGRIGHSHWWPVGELRSRLGPSCGAPSDYPIEWTTDPVKVACLLRVADAMHVDSRRAPPFLRALRKPRPGSQEHWIFQERLHKPQLCADRLAFTSGRPFGVDEADAWWICFETLQMVDRELRHVDALLADLGGPRLAAVGVLGADDAARMCSQITTDGWKPIDARVKVGDVAAVVERLGGAQLYGDDPSIALRELIQNATDAVRARRAVDHLPDDFGVVTVRLGRDERGDWIEVEDNGIGMSLHVLTNTLLDFGTSYWGSPAMRQEWPGLLASGFEATGKYGIGFFSVFMWGKHVRVTTRSLHDARKDTRVLEFRDGPAGRPVVRAAKDSEWILEAGTRVRVWPQRPLDDEEGLLRMQHPRSFEQLCGWLCPALDVDLRVQRGSEEPTTVVRANDWLTLPADQLVERTRNQLGSRWVSSAGYETEWTPAVGEALRPVYRDGKTVGRVALYRERASNLAHGVVCVGGLRASDATGIFGVLLGVPTTAARDTAMPLPSLDEMKRWAQEQASLIAATFNDPEIQAECAELALLFGAEPRSTPLVRRRDEWMSLDQLGAWAGTQKEIRLVNRDGRWWMIEERGDFCPRDDLLILPARSVEVIRPGRHRLWPNNVWDAAEPAVVAEIAKAWNMSFDDLAKFEEGPAEVGERLGKKVNFASVRVLRRA